MSEIKISEILHTAADEYLWSGRLGLTFLVSHEYSCNAIWAAISKDGRISLESKDNFFRRVKTGLTRMGLLKHGIPHCWGPYREKFDQKIVQQERYSWLKFAAMIAEEQGV